METLNILFDLDPMYVYAADDEFVVAMDDYTIATFDNLDDAIDAAESIYDEL